jgi:hypothetical protein
VSFEVIALAGESIVRYLKTALAADPPVIDGNGPRQVTVSLADAASLKSIVDNPQQGKTSLTLLLYRIDVNRALRATMGMLSDRQGETALPLDLFYLLTAWAPNPTEEHLIIGRAMQALEAGSPLSGPAVLTRIGGMTRDVALGDLALVIDELSNEALMRIFDSLKVEYRLSIPYIARVVSIIARVCEPGPPVLDEQIRFMVPA